MARRDDDDDDDDRDRDRDDEDDGEDRKSKKKKKGGEVSEDDEKLWGMLAHLSPLIGLGFIGPLIVMMMYKDKSKFVEENAKEALNFNLTALIIIFGGMLLCGIGILYAPVAMIFSIIAGLAANKGEKYQYPMTIRFVK